MMYGLTNIFGFDLNKKGPNIYNNDMLLQSHKYQKPFIVAIKMMVII